MVMTAGDVQPKRRLLLACQWREAVLVNYEIDPKVLQPLVPPGTQLDLYESAGLITLIARRSTGIAPHGWPRLTRSFNEVLLRFYVKRTTLDTTRHGVCVIRQFVSRRGPTWLMARLLDWPIRRLPIERKTRGFGAVDMSVLPAAEFRWRLGGQWNHVRASARSTRSRPQPGTKEHFVLTPTFAYSARGCKLGEYCVHLAPSAVWDASSASVECDFSELFGSHFQRRLGRRPTSVFLIRGNEVKVFRPEYAAVTSAE
jgi:hypothetical protein